ncbi:PAS domain S-box-containing protein [Humitalea rosea]|uniref:histidine kinase n=1 Tax=Humitalea rosea TaxID=990373 RepID=A0A2W7IDV0_9PROT|nr:PAS domain S-box protein [Humitalea rosea]PZW44914.1 PAS domain S-box-containing protein [Humitalea rosea]
MSGIISPKGAIDARRAPGRAPAGTWPLARVIALLTALATIPPTVVATISAWNAAEREVSSNLDVASEAARRGARNIQRALGEQRAAMLALAATEGPHTENLAWLVAAWPQATGLCVLLADAAGGVVAANDSVNGAVPLPPPARAALIAAAISGTSQVSSAFTVAGSTEVETLVAVSAGPGTRMALAIRARVGAFWLPLLDTLQLPAGWTASLVDRGGVILGHIPIGAGQAAARLRRPMGDWLRSSARGTQGVIRNTAELEQVYTAWHDLDDAPWTVIVTIPAHLVEDARYTALMPVLLGGGLAFIMTGLLGWGAGLRLGSAVRRIEGAAAGLGSGPGSGVPTSSTRITEVAAAEAAIAAAAGRLQSQEAEARTLASRLVVLQESTADAILGLDRAFHVTWMNGRARRMLGELAEDMLGKGLFDMLPACTGGPFEAAYVRAMNDRAPQRVTAWHASLNRWISADAYPGEDGGLTLFLRDAGSHRTAEDALRESEARLRAVLDHVPVGVLLAEAPSGRVVFGNRRLEEVMGHPVRQLSDLGADAGWDAFNADGRRLQPSETPLGQALAHGAAASRELLYRRGDGTTTWLRASAAPIRDADGQMTGAVMAVTDVAVERRAGEALRESELRFRTLAEAVPQIVWSARPDGGVDYVNPRFTEFTGRPAHEASLPGSPVLHPDDAPAVRTAWVSALAAGRAFAAEYRMRGADGSWRWFAARALPARGPEGAVRRWIGAATDVTDLIAAREALQIQVLAEANARAEAVASANALAISEERFRRFGSASPDVLWITDAAGTRVDYVSPAFERIWGAGCAALMGDASLWTRLVHPDDRDRVAATRAGPSRADSIELEYRVVRPDGQERWIRDRAFPIADAVGGFYARGGIARDVTEAKAAEARQRLLIGELNHRVKNTLATVHSLSLQTARGPLAAAGLRTLPQEADAAAGGAIVRFVLDLQARIMALSRAHDLLTATTWQGATLRETVRSALTPWLPRVPDEVARVEFGGESAWLAPKQALGLALALHELATNAAKHGGLSVPEGRVEVRWHRIAEGRLQLDWIERGGPPVAQPTRQGFGTRLLQRGLAGELGVGASVALDYAPAGFAATIIFAPTAHGPGAGIPIEVET